jgi:hypothetical protein
MLRWTGIALFILGLIDAAHAHFVWLEREGDGPARAYFGEWIDDIREKTGGLLDRFKTPCAYRQQHPTARGQRKIRPTADSSFAIMVRLRRRGQMRNSFRTFAVVMCATSSSERFFT